MTKERVSCYTKGCGQCANGTCIQGKKGKVLYQCSAEEKPHEERDARKCLSFRCSVPNSNGVLCTICKNAER